MWALKASLASAVEASAPAAADEGQLQILRALGDEPGTVQVEQLAAERRAEPRYAVAVDVGWNTDHNFYLGLSENLSEGGLFVATYDDLPLGTTLLVTLQLPDAAPIVASARVRWVRAHSRFTRDLSPGVGLQFVQLDDTARAAIRAFLAGREAIFYDEGEVPG